MKDEYLFIEMNLGCPLSRDLVRFERERERESWVSIVERSSEVERERERAWKK